MNAAHYEETVDEHMMEVLRQIAVVNTYPPGTFLTRQGESERTFYVLESGCVVVSRLLEDGQG